MASSPRLVPFMNMRARRVFRWLSIALFGSVLLAGIFKSGLATGSVAPTVVLAQGAREFLPPPSCFSADCHKREKELLEKNDGDGKGKQHENAKNQLTLDGKDKDKVEKYAKALGLSTQAEILDPKNGCTKCHATVYTARNRLTTAGVTCQSCHGAAGPEATGYLKIHQDIKRLNQPKENDPAFYRKSVTAGLNDARVGPKAWVPICAECHVLGNSANEKKIIDAGHPSGDDFKPAIDKVTPVSKHWYQTNKYKAGDLAAELTPIATRKAAGRTASATPPPPPPPPPAKADPKVEADARDRAAAEAKLRADAEARLKADEDGRASAKAVTDAAAATAAAVATGGAAVKTESPAVTAPPPPIRETPRERPAQPRPAFTPGVGTLVTQSTAPPPSGPAFALPQSPAALLGAVQGRLAALLEALLTRGVQAPSKIDAPKARVSTDGGADAELLRLQEDIIALALEALSAPAKAPAAPKKDR